MGPVVDGKCADFFQIFSSRSRWAACHHPPGQFITTSAEVTPNGSLSRESPQNPLNSGLGIIVICHHPLIRVF